MPVTIDSVVVFSLGGIAGYFVRTIIEHFLAKSRTREDREAKSFSDAATTFRNKILAELQGIYPIPPLWQPQDYPRFSQSIPKVETAASEFRPFVKRKADLDTAIKKYREYCQSITFESVSAWYMYTSMRQPDDIGPVETFRKVIEQVLSFTERK
jgi:hypothetical protein